MEKNRWENMKVGINMKFSFDEGVRGDIKYGYWIKQGYWELEDEQTLLLIEQEQQEKQEQADEHVLLLTHHQQQKQQQQHQEEGNRTCNSRVIKNR